MPAHGRSSATHSRFLASHSHRWKAPLAPRADAPTSRKYVAHCASATTTLQALPPGTAARPHTHAGGGSGGGGGGGGAGGGPRGGGRGLGGTAGGHGGTKGETLEPGSCESSASFPWCGVVQSASRMPCAQHATRAAVRVKRLRRWHRVGGLVGSAG